MRTCKIISANIRMTYTHIRTKRVRTPERNNGPKNNLITRVRRRYVLTRVL